MSVLSLADAKAHLNITGTAANLGDAELQALIESAEDIIGARVGPLTTTARTDRVRSDGYSLILPVTPVVSLTSVSGVGVSQSANVASLRNGEAGVVTWSDASAGFTAGLYDVTYVAGYSSVPDGLLWAVKEQVRHLVASQRGAGGRPGSGDQGAGVPGYLVPHAVAEAMEPYVQEFGFA